jgi:hypothetical protein
MDEQERLKILEMIDSGQISAQDGIKLLNALNGDSTADAIAGEDALPEPDADSIDAPEETQEDSGEAGISEDLDPEAGPEGTWDGVYELHEESPVPDTPQVEEAEPTYEEEPQVITPPEPFDPSQLKWRNFWWIPMWVGMGILIIGAILMYAAWNASGFGFGFACTWVPFLLGVAVVALAWSSRTARWLHVRVHQKPGQKPEKIAISLPIPLRLTAWFLRMFGDRIPNMQGTSLDEVILALDATSPDAPFYVEVNEGEDGERVEVYIG